MEDEALHLFTLLDYSLFFGMLALSALIGAYFGFFGNKQDSPKEYLHGGKNMSILPVAASLIATEISAITLLACPADVYINGSAYSMAALANIAMTVVILYVFLPVFYKLQVTSSFEYLQIRFSKRVCVMTSFIFAFITVLYLPVLIYIPALAFNQVSGLNLNIVIPLVCIICVFYTTIGGIKAVVWTDTLQMVIMIGSILVVFFFGVSVEGGFGNIWDKASKGDRINFNFNADPTDKQAFVTVFIGFTVLFAGVGSNPVFTQRFLAVPTIADSKKAALIFCVGTVSFKALSWFLGLIIFAHYSDCSPLAAGYIKKPDQILPYYIMDVSSTLPGLPGIFIAGLFCAALSSISSGLNTMAGTIYEDLIKPFMPKNTTDKRASDCMKMIVVALGIISIALVFAVQYLGAILQLTVSLGGVVVGPILALFTLGMLVPHVNEKGIFYGSIAGLVFVAWIIFGALYYKLNGKMVEEFLPLSTESCEYINRTTPVITAKVQEDQPFYLYRITYYYYSLAGFLSTAIVALPISYFTGGFSEFVHKDLLSPIIHPFLKKQPKETDDDMENAKELEKLNRIDTQTNDIKK